MLTRQLTWNVWDHFQMHLGKQKWGRDPNLHRARIYQIRRSEGRRHSISESPIQAFFVEELLGVSWAWAQQRQPEMSTDVPNVHPQNVHQNLYPTTAMKELGLVKKCMLSRSIRDYKYIHLESTRFSLNVILYWQSGNLSLTQSIMHCNSDIIS